MSWLSASKTGICCYVVVAVEMDVVAVAVVVAVLIVGGSL